MSDTIAKPALPRWMDLALTIVMALAAVSTAWAGFQSAKWSGMQTISFAQAGAARTESTRASTEAGQERLIDVVTFTSWMSALQEEIIAGVTERPDGEYEPSPDELSGILYQRFRPEFRTAVDAWLKTRPLVEPDSPPTPFAMPEYRLKAEERAADLVSQAENHTAQARTDNQRSDNYVFMAVILALGLFFAGVAGRANTRNSQWFLFVAATLTFVGAVVVLLLLPKTF